MGMTLTGFLQGQSGRELALRAALDRLRVKDHERRERMAKARRRH